MSIEVIIKISATFIDEEIANFSTSELKKSLKKHQYELSNSLDALNPIENISQYQNESIYVEDIARKNNVLSISAYTYSSEEPTWFAKSLTKLGASRIFIRGIWDGIGRNHYFLNGKKVPKKIFDGDKPKKELGVRDIEINKGLFLPDGRITVKVELISAEPAGDIYESTLLKFKTTNDDIFYYKGSGQLVDIFWEHDKGEYNTSVMVEFSATFERGKIKTEFASFAKRPTKITVCKS